MYSPYPANPLLAGYFTLPVTCLIEPVPNRPLRPEDSVFTNTLRAHMKRNPFRDVTHIVELIQLQDREGISGRPQGKLPLLDTGWQQFKSGHAAAAERG